MLPLQLFCGIALLLLVPSLCIPEMWADPELAEDATPALNFVPTCLAHPKALYGPHALGELTRDTESTLEITLGGRPGNTLCPGAKHNVKITFPLPRQAVLTTTLGKLPPSTSEQYDGKCRGVRQMFGNEMVPFVTTTLDVPCSAAGKKVVLAVTSSMGTLDGFHSFSSTHKVATSCPAANAASSTKCGSAAAGAPPSRASNTSSPAPKPKPSPKPRSPNAHSPKPAGPKGPGIGSLLASDGSGCTIEEMQDSKELCEQSALGYGCAITNTVANTAIHISYGACAPVNNCTLAATAANTTGGSAGMQAGQAMLHFAIEAPTAGYVSLGFAHKAGFMPKTDAVVGFVTPAGRLSVGVYGIEGISMPKSSKYDDSLGMLAYSGVVATAEEATLLCFARPLSVPGAKYSAQVNLSSVKLNWAVGRGDLLVEHYAKGGMVLDFEGGSESSTDDKAKSNAAAGLAAAVSAAWLAAAAGTLLACTCLL